MKLQLPIHIPEEIETDYVPETTSDEQITVPIEDSCVPDSHMRFIVRKVAELLKSQGIPCVQCPKSQYILSALMGTKTFTLS